eukprot:scaffold48863_cov58-Phaeocystis_antarctica.AAC.3
MDAKLECVHSQLLAPLTTQRERCLFGAWSSYPSSSFASARRPAAAAAAAAARRTQGPSPPGRPQRLRSAPAR